MFSIDGFPSVENIQVYKSFKKTMPDLECLNQAINF
jgi:hypothetical protein